MEISVVVPVYKGENTLEKLFLLLEKTFFYIPDWELVLIHDNGPDNSWKIIKKIHSEHTGRIKAIKLKENFGQHVATTIGLINSEGEYIVTMDEDLQYDPRDTLRLIETLRDKNADLVYGVPDRSFHGMLKRIGSVFLKNSLKFSDYYMRGDYSSFRVINRSLVEKILRSDLPFFFIDASLNRFSRKVVTLKVRHCSRESGSSSYTAAKLAVHAFKIIIVFTHFVKYIMVFNLLLLTGIILFSILNTKVANGFQNLFILIIAGLVLVTSILLFLKNYFSKGSFKNLKVEPDRLVEEFL